MTSEELDMMEALWRGSMSIKMIASKLGYSANHITRTAMRNRDRFPYRHRNIKGTRQERKVERKRAVSRIVAGESTLDLEAKRLGVNRETVRNWVWRERKKWDCSH